MKRNNRFLTKTIGLTFFLLFCSSISFGQSKETEKSILRDTLDNKLDFSRFIIDAHGFLPVFMLITEPALGGIGVGVLPLFLKPKKSSDSTEYLPPDITTAFGMYTANGSWSLGGARMGSIPKWGLKYRIAGGYGNVNLAFYRELPFIGEKELEFNIKSIPIHASISKKISKSDIYIGVNYLFMSNVLSPNFNSEVPDFISDRELDNITSTISLFTEWDKRDNIFTPDKGFRANVSYGVNAEWTGSDFEYERINASLSYFNSFIRSMVSGFRVETQHVFNSPPFYLLPSINMRGIPAARYQGETTALIETEQRYDFNLRWSAVLFGGLATAVNGGNEVADHNLIYNWGGGFRYLLARAFKVRAGVDLGFSDDSWGYYITFGHNWNR